MTRNPLAILQPYREQQQPGSAGEIPRNPEIQMTTAMVALQSFWSRLSPNPCSNGQQICTPLASPSFYSVAFLKKGMKRRSNGRFQQLPRRSSEGSPSELVEDPKFVPLNSDDPVYGPPALLLLGFEAGETEKIKKLLKELGGEFLKVIHCTEDMIAQSLWDAMHTEQPRLDTVKIAKTLPRICFLSGLSGEETMMFIDAFPETGLEPAIFAALVPNSADKRLGDVMEEIMGDHEMLSAKKSS